MPSRDVEIVRKFYEDANRRDVDAALEAIDKNLEFRTAGAFPDLEPGYSGRDAYRAFLERFAELWKDLSIEVEQIVEGRGGTVALFRFRATGRDGIRVDLPFAHVWTIRNGRAVRLDAYSDREEALEAVGAEGQGPSA